jgi:hypothetical protein
MGYILDVILLVAEGYTLDIHTAGGRKGYTWMSIQQAAERDTPWTSILLALEMDTPFTSILLAVESDTPCTFILLVVESDTPCKTIDFCCWCYSCYTYYAGKVICKCRIVGMPEKVNQASAVLQVVNCLSPASAFRHQRSVRYRWSWNNPALPSYVQQKLCSLCLKTQVMWLHFHRQQVFNTKTDTS